MASRTWTFVIVLLGLAGAVALIYLFLLLMPYLLLVVFQQAPQAPMHCWVKVVDQNENGVNPYKVEVTEHGVPLIPFFSRAARLVAYETQKDGMFEYQSKGAVSLVVFGHWDTQWKLNRQDLLQRQDLGVNALQLQDAINKNPTGYVGSKDNPYLLHVFSLGPPQKLLYNKVVIMLKDPKDYFCMDILSGKTWESEKPEGDVAMADGFGTRESPAPCIVIVKAGLNCELCPVLDDWGLGPPEEGYSKEICWPKSWEPRHYSLLGPWFYYRITRSGAPNVLYGKVKFGVREKVNGAVIECFTNLQGERNLYFKGYEQSVLTTDPGQIADYISPPVQ